MILGEESVQSAALAGASHPRVRRSALGWAYRRAAVVTAPSPGVVGDLVAELAIADATFAVIPNMVDLEAIERCRPGAGAPPVQRRPDCRCWWPPGGCSRPRARPTSWSAHELLSRTRPANLLVLGAGPDRRRLERLAGELGIAGRVAFTGFVANPYALMRQADVFVSPSHAESFGNVIVEAMAAGAPVVSTRVPCGPETIITDGVTGSSPGRATRAISPPRSIPCSPTRRRPARSPSARQGSIVQYDVDVVVGRYEDLLDAGGTASSVPAKCRVSFCACPPKLRSSRTGRRVPAAPSTPARGPEPAPTTTRSRRPATGSSRSSTASPTSPAGAGRRVLEIGVGAATDFLNFARAGAVLTGVDLTPAAVEHARAGWRSRGLEAELAVASGEALPFPDGSFDLVYSWGVIHHAEHPHRIVREIRRLLAPERRGAGDALRAPLLGGLQALAPPRPARSAARAGRWPR